MSDQPPMDIRPVTLEGAHVRLAPLEPGHHAALAALLTPGLTRWFPQPVMTADGMRAFIDAALKERDAGVSLPFTIFDRAGGAVAGGTRFLAIDRAHRRVEIGATFLGHDWQRTALNTEAKLLMMTHAFERWGCVRVEFKTDSLNITSRAAILRLGAVEEGYFRNHMVTASGRLRHTVWYSVTAEEWALVKRGLQEKLARGKVAA